MCTYMHVYKRGRVCAGFYKYRYGHVGNQVHIRVWTWHEYMYVHRDGMITLHL
jgi:hypothetical protein